MNQNLLTTLQWGSKLGEGHFGAVYEAYDRVLGKVAVKVFGKLPEWDSNYWDYRRRCLLNEGQRLKDAEHEHVVQVFQVLEAEQQDFIYLVMEFCPNGSLQSYFEKGPMSLKQLRSILNDVTLGLQAIHARNLLHRDIKPANILLDQDGRAKLGDFGLVTNDLVWGYASAVGYLDHLAIESHHDEVTSIRTDVWALGMTVYRLLHGEQFYQQLPPPKDLVPLGGFADHLPWLPHIPKEWRRFVKHLMHDDPVKRCPDAVRVLSSLEKLPISPDWQCTFTGERVVWQRTTKERRIEVVWTKHSPRHHQWTADSYPLESGKKHRIDGSIGIINRTTAVKELRAFFESRQRSR